METSLRIKLSELDTDLIAKLKRLFGKDKEVNVTIQSVEPDAFSRKESKKAYLARLEKAVRNLERGERVEMSTAELDAFFLEKLKG
ncbi:MAG: hypothetical protein JST45_03985 [Bacteroidetes bacterium]|nr:hypothetical protein [Bacteroidota bacterium]